MKILFIARSTLYSNPGGDTIQLTRTVLHLKRMGFEADTCLTNSSIDYSGYDLIHYFNIIRPADILSHISRSKKPFVVSTIFVDYHEYEKKCFTGFRKILAHILSPDGMEYLKVIARLLVNKESVASSYYIFHGQRKSVKKVLSAAAMLLPNSHSEYRRLKARYQVDNRYKVVPNGIDTTLFAPSPQNAGKEQNLVLCVARIEPLKNQLLLIRALNNTALRLIVVGRPSVNQKKYYARCRKEAGRNVTFMDYVSQEELVSIYAKAKVHVLPSWFETTGLSSLEAAAMGCNIVITDKGDTTEYFGDYAYYCNPESPDSILEAVSRAANDPVNDQLAQRVLNHYTWEQAARVTAESYREVLLNG